MSILVEYASTLNNSIVVLVDDFQEQRYKINLDNNDRTTGDNVDSLINDLWDIDFIPNRDQMLLELDLPQELKDKITNLLSRYEKFFTVF